VRPAPPRSRAHPAAPRLAGIGCDVERPRGRGAARRR